MPSNFQNAEVCGGPVCGQLDLNRIAQPDLVEFWSPMSSRLNIPVTVLPTAQFSDKDQVIGQGQVLGISLLKPYFTS